MLSRKVSMSDSFKGIKPSSFVKIRDISEIKTVQYADDTAVLIKDGKRLQIALNIIQHFLRLSMRGLHEI